MSPSWGWAVRACPLQQQQAVRALLAAGAKRGFPVVIRRARTTSASQPPRAAGSRAGRVMWVGGLRGERGGAMIVVGRCECSPLVHWTGVCVPHHGQAYVSRLCVSAVRAHRACRVTTRIGIGCACRVRTMHEAAGRCTRICAPYVLLRLCCWAPRPMCVPCVRVAQAHTAHGHAPNPKGSGSVPPARPVDSGTQPRTASIGAGPCPRRAFSLLRTTDSIPPLFFCMPAAFQTHPALCPCYVLEPWGAPCSAPSAHEGIGAAWAMRALEPVLYAT